MQNISDRLSDTEPIGPSLISWWLNFYWLSYDFI